MEYLIVRFLQLFKMANVYTYKIGLNVFVYNNIGLT